MLRWFYVVAHLLAEAGAARRDPPGYEPKQLTARKLLPIRKLQNQQELRDTGTRRHVVHAVHVERDFSCKLVARQAPPSRT
jgi:hypothetical protein